MSDRILVRGIGVAGGFGCGREALRAAMASLPGPRGERLVRTAEGEVSAPAYLADAEALSQYVPARKLRRVDRFSRLAALAVRLAFADAGREIESVPRLGVILASGYGSNVTTFEFLDSCARYGDAGASPLLFSGSGHSGALSNVTILLGIEGPLLTICQPTLAVPMAIAAAVQWLRESRVDAVAVGAAEELFPHLDYVRRSQFGKAEEGPLRPFNFDAQTAVAGEGAAFLLIEKGQGGAPSLGAVSFGRALAAEDVPAGSRVILGADGHRCEGRAYARVAARRDTLCASYAPVFGSVPTRMAFNLAIAAMGLQEGFLPPRPEFGADLLAPNRGASRILCLDLFKGGEFGSAAVERV